MATSQELLDRLSFIESQRAKQSRTGVAKIAGEVGGFVAERAKAVVKEPVESLKGIAQTFPIGKPTLGEAGEIQLQFPKFEEPETERGELARKTVTGISKLGQSIALGAAIPGGGIGTSVLKKTGLNILRGVVSETPFQREAIEADEFKKAGKGFALSAAFGVGGQFLKSAGKTIRRGIDDFFETVSKMSPEALRTFGLFGIGNKFQKVKEIAGKSNVIAREFVETINKPNKFLQAQNETVKKAVKAAKPIEINSIVDALERSKIPERQAAAPVVDAANNAIEDLKNRLIKIAKTTDKGNFIDAEDLLQIRRTYDAELKGLFGQNLAHADFVEKATMNAASEMRQLLRKSAGPEFTQTMEELSNKLDAVSQLKRFARGKTKGQKVETAERFFQSLGRSTTPQERQQLLETFDIIFEKDFADKSKLLIFANELIDPQSIIRKDPQVFALGQADISLFRKIIGSPFFAGPATLGAETGERLGRGITKLAAPVTPPAILRRIITPTGQVIISPFRREE